MSGGELGCGVLALWRHRRYSFARDVDVQEYQFVRSHHVTGGRLGHPVEDVQPLFVTVEQLRIVGKNGTGSYALAEAEVALDRVHSAAVVCPVALTETEMVQECLGRLGERDEIVRVHHVADVVDPLGRHGAPPGREQVHSPVHRGVRRSANASAPSRASRESSILASRRCRRWVSTVYKDRPDARYCSSTPKNRKNASELSPKASR